MVGTLAIIIQTENASSEMPYLHLKETNLFFKGVIRPQGKVRKTTNDAQQKATDFVASFRFAINDGLQNPKPRQSKGKFIFYTIKIIKNHLKAI